MHGATIKKNTVVLEKEISAESMAAIDFTHGINTSIW